MKLAARLNYTPVVPPLRMDEPELTQFLAAG